MALTPAEQRRRNAIALLNMAIMMAATSGSGSETEISYFYDLTVTPDTGGTTATLAVELNPMVGSGDVFFVVALASATVPTGAQIVLGVDGSNAAAVWDATSAYNAVNSFTGPITGLTAETNYVLYAVWFDGVDVYSSVASYAFTSLEGVVLPDPGEFVRVTEAGEQRNTEGGEQRTLETVLADVLSGFNVTPIAGGTTASFEVTTSAEGGQFYIVTYLASATDPDEEQIEAGKDGDDVLAATGLRSSVELSSIDDYIPGITGLTQNTAYKSRAVVRLSATPGDYSNIVSDSWTSADAAPILTSMLAVATGSTTALFSVITDDISGSIKWGVFASAATPSKADILAGTGALDYGSVSVSGTGLYSVLDITGLSASTAYKVHAYHVDAGALESSIITSSAFSTKAAETIKFQTAQDGTISGDLTTAFLTVTTAQADPLGGSNAITASHDPGGSSATCSLSRLQSSPLWELGTNRFRFYIKKNAWASSAAWVRCKMLNTTPAPSFNFNLDTGATSTLPSQVGNFSAISVGDGWWFVQFDIDFSAASDRNGSYVIYLASSSSSQTITTSGTHSISLFDYQGVY